MPEITRKSSPYSYSLGVAAGNFVFLALHRGSGDDFETQLDGTIKNIKETLAEFGLTLAHLVKVNVWLKNIKDLPKMEKKFNDYFDKGAFPARMTSTTEFVDEDCLIMIDGIAARENQEIGL